MLSEPSDSSVAPPALDVRDLWFGYGPDRPILKGVDVQAEAGRITMIVGVSGGGKTTLLKLVKGILRPDRGTISVLGARPAARIGGGGLDPRVAYIPQQLGLVRSLTALDNVLVGGLSRVGTLRSLVKAFPSAYVQEARDTLDALGIAHKADDKVYGLSGGERQRVAIARALMQQPRLILADEFVSQLDPATTVEMMEIMRGIAERGVTLVMTTHEMGIVDRYAARVVLLRDGEKVLDAPAREVVAENLRTLMKV
jgi:phosphonate transport system ATP-binding protein